MAISALRLCCVCVVLNVAFAAKWSLSLAAERLREAGAIQLSKRPLLFRLPKFLSNETIEGLIAEATPSLHSSGTGLGFGEPSQSQAWSFDVAQKTSIFRYVDGDQDGVLDSSETRRFMSQWFNMANHNHKHLLAKLKRKQLGLEEFVGFDFAAYDKSIRTKSPHLSNRHSSQTWLNLHRSPAAQAVVANIEHVFAVSPGEFMNSEPLQVVHYGPKSHYACHTDSDEKSLQRLATVLVFLSDDFSGGLLSFPYANHNITDEDWIEMKTQCLPVERCGSSFSVAPIRGDAVIWFNAEPYARRRKKQCSHSRGAEWKLVRESMHAGCPVRKGTKWIANLWLPMSLTN
eukprot:TRINITY_DN32939_c0_g1_i1.p1 TRINITY_DN32939_c0_g1~~TRINITY_DN32939_c0_g1_i1.p1  ORF type:complete len:367 (-),score=47.02 TRINITY_DN32939_c0_g1_i1:120-1154(-)